MELLTTIALLCQTSSSLMQLNCQQEYLNCYLKKVNEKVTIQPALPITQSQKFLIDCVLERK